ncbi:MAG: metallophosphoesterase family protein, partial [Bacillota bacterium]
MERFKFLVFGDSQSTSYALWRATLHGAYGANANAAFFTNVGDLVDQGQDYNQWNGWFNAAEGVIDNIPAMPITGNHEYYTAERGRTAWPVFFTTQFKLPQNGPA